MESRSGIGILRKSVLLLLAVAVVAVLLSSCVLVKDNTKPIISEFTKSATLLSQHMIYFKANILDTGSGLGEVAFELNHSPLPVTKEGSDLFVAKWLGVYGSYNITVLAQDKAGNIATKTDSFFVADSTPPVVKVKLPTTVAKGVNFPLSVKAYDLQSGMKNISLEVDGENVPVSDNEILEWSFSTKGVHTICLTAVNNQGLVTIKKFNVNVVNERKTPPYAQFMLFPQSIQSGKSATFSVYAYSPNGIKKVELKMGKSTELAYFPSKGNIYTFHFLANTLTNKVIYATCTVYDTIGMKKEMVRPIVLLSNNSTSAALFPGEINFKVDKKSTCVKLPFFVGSVERNLKVKAYVDGVPVDVIGDLPKMFALWNPLPGIHVLAIAVDGKIISEKKISSFFPSKNPSTSLNR